MADAVITVQDNRAIVTIAGDVGGLVLKEAIAAQKATQAAIAAAIAADGDAAVAGALAGQAAAEDVVDEKVDRDFANLTETDAIQATNTILHKRTGTGTASRTQKEKNDDVAHILDFLGVDLSGENDSTSAVQELMSQAGTAGANIDLGNGRLALIGEIVAPNVKINVGGITLDFSNAVSETAFPNKSCFYMDGGDAVQLPDLADDVPRWSRTLPLAGSVPPEVTRGRRIQLVDPGDYSFFKNLSGGAMPTASFLNPASPRPFYRAGGDHRIWSVDDTEDTITLYDPLDRAYLAANMEVWLVPDRRPRLIGSLDIIGSAAVSYGAKFRRLSNGIISGVSVLNSLLAAITFSECSDIQAIGLNGIQDLDAGGNDYGLLMESCNRSKFSGSFVGRRHATTVGPSETGGGNIQIPCRDFVIEGPQVTLTDVYAFGGHGPIERGTIIGPFKGGVLTSGNHMTYIGHVTPVDLTKPLIDTTEWWGMDQDMGGLTVHGQGVNATASPTLGGTVCLGRVGNSPDADTLFGGRIIMPQKIYCDTARPIKMESTGYTGPRARVNFGSIFEAPVSSAIVHETHGGDVAYIADWKDYDDETGELGYVGFEDVSCRNWMRTGNGSLSFTSGNSAASGTAVVFKAPKPYPSITVNSEPNVLGGKKVKGRANNPDQGGFTPVMETTTDAATFSSSGSGGFFNWLAVLHEE